jgi:hypothetical protein
MRSTAFTTCPHLRRRQGASPIVVATLALLALAAPAAAQVPDPTITGPVPSTAIPGQPSHDYIYFATSHDLAIHGYVEEEFLVEGTASRYMTPALATGTILSSGHPYRTRIVVRRPVERKRFNGTVLVEWYNVTNGFDAENTWFFVWEDVLRSGYAWVGVSAQNVGVSRLRSFSPTRYGSLDVTAGGTVTGDALSYDIFSQAGQAIKHPAGVDLLGGLAPKVVIATGESQSASRLSTYVNSIHPLANVYDGFLLLSSLGNRIRTDLGTPVWKVSAEYDVAQSEAAARQPDTDMIRLWEVAGTSHVDHHLRLSREPLDLRDNGSSSAATLAPTCGVPTLGTRVPMQYVLAAAYDHLVRWITKGTPPPTAPLIEIASFGPGNRATIQRDALGLALGGIRLAELAVPTAVNNGVNTGPGACERWGYYIPFDLPTLRALYPRHADYADAVKEVTKENRRRGYILQPDADATTRAAENSVIGRFDNLGVPRKLPLSDFDRNP